jgi:hypothetical protein
MGLNLRTLMQGNSDTTHPWSLTYNAELALSGFFFAASRTKACSFSKIASALRIKLSWTWKAGWRLSAEVTSWVNSRLTVGWGMRCSLIFA